LAANITREARAWLSGGEGRNLGEHDSKESIQIVESLYRRGAREVIAVGGTDESTDILIVVLPDDENARAQVFDFQNAYDSEFDPTPDEGQKYMFLFKFKGHLYE
jgi:hypothetical protein